MLRLNHEELLAGFRRTNAHLMLKGLLLQCASKIVGSRAGAAQPMICIGEAGSKMSNETEDYLLSSCEQLNFNESLREISPLKHREFESLPGNLECAWLLGGCACIEFEGNVYDSCQA